MKKKTLNTKSKPKCPTYEEVLAQQKRNNPNSFQEMAKAGLEVLSKQRSYTLEEMWENERRIQSGEKFISKRRRKNDQKDKHFL